MLGADEEAQGEVVVEVVPYPVDEDHDFISHSYDEEDMDDEPHPPGEEASEVHFCDVYDCGVSPDGGHGAFVVVGEYLFFIGLAFGAKVEVGGESSRHLQGDLGDLWVAFGVLFVCEERCIAQGEVVFVS